MRRKDRERDETFAYEVLDRCRYAVLATVNPDGSPYCVPISPARYGSSVYFHCAPAGHKLDNITQNPKVCMTFVGEEHIPAGTFTVNYESGILFGSAVMVGDREEKIRALRYICEKYTPENMAYFDSEVQKALKYTAICRIDVERITGKKKG